MSTTFQPFQHLYTHIKRQDPRLYEALDKISLNLQNLSGNQSNQVLTNIVSSTFLALTLTGASFISSPIYPAEGSLLVVLLIQDGTGGHIPSWDSSFGTVDDPGSLSPNTYNSYVFIGHAGRWWLVNINISNIK